MTVRCKFKCVSKREYSSMSKKLFDYQFTAVMNGSDENKAFWEWTPAGTLSVSSVTDGQFEIEQEYYLDLIPAVVK